MKVLIIDNFDSFTYNLYHYVREFVEDCIVVRSSDLSKFNIQDYDKIILSPGPSLPSDHPVIFDVLNRFSKTKSILGICLGHQAIGAAFGARIISADDVFHGKTSNIYHNNHNIFRGIPSSFTATRYHSLIIDRNSLSDEFSIIAETSTGLIMGIKHIDYELYGLQFHPESILTDNGIRIIKNFLS